MAPSEQVVRINAEGESAPWPGASAVVIGNFDGVHKGHQAVLAEARTLATERNLATTVLTFDPHPASVLFNVEPLRLTSLPRRVALLTDFADRVCVRTFDRPYSETTPEHFAETLLAATLRAKLVVVGENFRFGHKRAGDLPQLRALGETLGFEVVAHALAGDATGRYSSSRAREAATQGDLATVEALLGRPHSISGRVVRGDQRGRTIGFPTANLGDVTEIVPSRGVYAVRVDRIRSAPDALLEETVPLATGVMNHGIRPTVAHGLAPTVEVHLFDFVGDLYGQALRVHLIAKLRDEAKFDGLDALKAQIARDVAAAKAILRPA
jgi:riboflavin kinase/FMN adenylyltransferase